MVVLSLLHQSFCLLACLSTDTRLGLLFPILYQLPGSSHFLCDKTLLPRFTRGSTQNQTSFDTNQANPSSIITMYASGLLRDRRELLRQCHHKQDNSRHQSPNHRPNHRPASHPDQYENSNGNENAKMPEQPTASPPLFPNSEVSPRFLASLWGSKQ